MSWEKVNLEASGLDSFEARGGVSAMREGFYGLLEWIVWGRLFDGDEKVGNTGSWWPVCGMYSGGRVPMKVDAFAMSLELTVELLLVSRR